jgi:anthranilate synthase component II
MRVLLLDNGDPCLENLLEPLRSLDAECDVRPSGSLQLEQIRNMSPQPQRILLTPGPGRPEDAGVCPEVVLQLGGNLPVMGIGLGMQVIAQVGRGALLPVRSAKSGTAIIRHDAKNLFAGLPNPFDAPRDPSPALTLDERRLPTDLEISARAEDGTIVGCRLWALGVEGFLVDSRWFSTRLGSDMLFNFLYQAQAW